MRKLSLMVLIYEGIVSGVFDYDYAPSSELIELRRVHLNISQEGRDALDVLVEAKLVNALRVSTKDHQCTVCYQASLAGLALLAKKLTEEDRLAVDDCIFVDGQLLMVAWTDSKFSLKNDTIEKPSTILDLEDVSYVSSPYLPKCLRRPGGPQMTSNASRANESVWATSALKDDLEEVITISNIALLVGEWIPFGPNQLVQLNGKLGSADRVQGGYLTTNVEADDVVAMLEVPAGLTRVQILDHDQTRFVNLEAEVFFPEEGDIVQVETFGLHVRSDGCVIYGLLVESVADRIIDNISLDMLSRLLVDMYSDSSKIMDSLISSHQLDLMDTTFTGSSESRQKVNIILAERIVPKQAAAKYMDRGVFENELRQVLGDAYEAHDLSDKDMLIIGSMGLLLVGPANKTNEPVLLAYLSLKSRDVFIGDIFNRLFMVEDSLKEVRQPSAAACCAAAAAGLEAACLACGAGAPHHQRV